MKNLQQHINRAQSKEVFYFTLLAEVLTALDEPTGLRFKKKKDVKAIFAECVGFCDKNIESMVLTEELKSQMSIEQQKVYLQKMKSNFSKLAGAIIDEAKLTIPEVLFLISVEFEKMENSKPKRICGKVYNLARTALAHFDLFDGLDSEETITRYKTILENAYVDLEIAD